MQLQLVSETEAKELKQILRRLKSLVLETETELERQDEVLGIITSSADWATMNIHKQTQRMKKITTVWVQVANAHYKPLGF
ncbi:hypothetical protein JRQ81_006564 [Phrynocephalus forsythii]|uniref:t-SNARE coiled-coil homology domain-containing protein n=1 Tax=Phrynocephalus forsythii TaxID=171643 RepID=A0A9Q1B642_9SAUR|nr:hypothetical protein JRQ81_006564 [Phrynocephalus forsythii]